MSWLYLISQVHDIYLRYESCESPVCIQKWVRVLWHVKRVIGFDLLFSHSLIDACGYMKWISTVMCTGKRGDTVNWNVSESIMRNCYSLSDRWVDATTYEVVSTVVWFAIEPGVTYAHVCASERVLNENCLANWEHLEQFVKFISLRLLFSRIVGL